MRKLVVILVSLFLAVSALAAGPFTLSGGVGQVFVSSSGNLFASTVDMEANLWLSGEFAFSDHFAAAATYTRDTAKVEAWLVKHNFVERTVEKYAYNRFDLAAEYIWNPSDKAVLYLKAGPSLFWLGDASALGLHAALGMRAKLTEHLGAITEIGYFHVQDFLPEPRVANAGEVRVGLSWRF